MSTAHTHKTSSKKPAAKAQHRTIGHARKQEQVRIMAARLRMTTDRRLNKPTPDWVKELAQKPL